MSFDLETFVQLRPTVKTKSRLHGPGELLPIKRLEDEDEDAGRTVVLSQAKKKSVPFGPFCAEEKAYHVGSVYRRLNKDYNLTKTASRRGCQFGLTAVV